MSRKKKQLPLLENITITDVAAEGKALARVDDMVYFHSICNTWRRRRCADNKEKKELL